MTTFENFSVLDIWWSIEPIIGSKHKPIIGFKQEPIIDNPPEIYVKFCHEITLLLNSNCRYFSLKIPREQTNINIFAKNLDNCSLGLLENQIENSNDTIITVFLSNNQYESLPEINCSRYLVINVEYICRTLPPLSNIDRMMAMNGIRTIMCDLPIPDLVSQKLFQPKFYLYTPKGWRLKGDPEFNSSSVKYAKKHYNDNIANIVDSEIKQYRELDNSGKLKRAFHYDIRLFDEYQKQISLSKPMIITTNQDQYQYSIRPSKMNMDLFHEEETAPKKLTLDFKIVRGKKIKLTEIFSSHIYFIGLFLIIIFPTIFSIAELGLLKNFQFDLNYLIAFGALIIGYVFATTAFYQTYTTLRLNGYNFVNNEKISAWTWGSIFNCSFGVLILVVLVVLDLWQQTLVEYLKTNYLFIMGLIGLELIAVYIIPLSIIWSHKLNPLEVYKRNKNIRKAFNDLIYKDIQK